MSSIVERLNVSLLYRKPLVESKMVGLILDKIRLFKPYAKTADGFKEFCHSELFEDVLSNKEDSFSIIAGFSKRGKADLVDFSTMEFLQLILPSFYYCNWNTELLNIIEDVLNNKLTPDIVNFGKKLMQGLTDISDSQKIITPTHVITLEMIPGDWVDLVVNLIKSENLDITKYSSVAELEKYIDFTLNNQNSIVEPCFNDPPEMNLMEEEKVEIARTLRLNPSDFNTKSEAMALYEKSK